MGSRCGDCSGVSGEGDYEFWYRYPYHRSAYNSWHVTMTCERFMSIMSSLYALRWCSRYSGELNAQTRTSSVWFCGNLRISHLYSGRFSKSCLWYTQLAKMIPVAVVVHLLEECSNLVVRLLAWSVRAAPFSRRVRQVILRRLLSDPSPT